jgi:hypothetical protein
MHMELTAAFEIPPLTSPKKLQEAMTFHHNVRIAPESGSKLHAKTPNSRAVSVCRKLTTLRG